MPCLPSFSGDRDRCCHELGFGHGSGTGLRLNIEFGTLRRGDRMQDEAACRRRGLEFVRLEKLRLEAGPGGVGFRSDFERTRRIVQLHRRPELKRVDGALPWWIADHPKPSPKFQFKLKPDPIRLDPLEEFPHRRVTRRSGLGRTTECRQQNQKDRKTAVEISFHPGFPRGIVVHTLSGLVGLTLCQYTRFSSQIGILLGGYRSHATGDHPSSVEPLLHNARRGTFRASPLQRSRKSRIPTRFLSLSYLR